MPPDERSAADDWWFPDVEPAVASPPTPTSPQAALGFEPTPYDALPATAAPAPTYPTQPPDAQDFAGWLPPPDPAPLPEFEPLPPPNLNVPRRTPDIGPVSPLRAMAGALVAVAGVLLGIGALLWATDEPKGDPTLSSQAQVVQSPSPAAVPSAAASPLPVRSPITAQSSPAAVARPTEAAPDPAPKLPLTVLNNSNRTLLADRAARRFAAAGWPIRLTGNFTGRVSETTVYYAPGQLRSALRLQRSFRGLTRVRPRFASLPGSGLTVVLTRSYSA